MGYPRISDNEYTQARYVEVRKNLKREAKAKGQEPNEVSDHRFAEMLALQSPPRSMTDRELFEGQGTLEKQFDGDDRGLNETVQNARRHGYNPNINDVYMPGLARFEGDPEAFVSPSGGRGQIRSVCEKRGWSCSGSVNVEGRQPEKDPLAGQRLGEDMVQEEVQKLRKKEPKASDRELREEVITKHSRKM